EQVWPQLNERMAPGPSTPTPISLGSTCSPRTATNTANMLTVERLGDDGDPAKQFLWGTFLWNLVDFSTDHRHEGDTMGRNDKGPVTADRVTQKDAYHYLRANWVKYDSDHPETIEAHIVGTNGYQRFAPSSGSKVMVKAYANTPMAQLTVNDVQPA